MTFFVFFFIHLVVYSLGNSVQSYVRLAIILAIGCLCASRAFASRKRLLKQLRSNDALVCVKCIYPIADLQAQGRCPECGRLYNHELTRSAWRRTMRRFNCLRDDKQT